MITKINNFEKEERLCSKKSLTGLFQNGSFFLIYPFRVTWLITQDFNQKTPVQVVVAVPKKRFKSSVDRNQIKRRIKEAYRLNKEELLYPALDLQHKKILLAISYVGKEIHDFSFMQQKILSMMKLLLKNSV
jgi:ribonuclease P protein component